MYTLWLALAATLPCAPRDAGQRPFDPQQATEVMSKIRHALPCAPPMGDCEHVEGKAAQFDTVPSLGKWANIPGTFTYDRSGSVRRLVLSTERWEFVHLDDGVSHAEVRRATCSINASTPVHVTVSSSSQRPMVPYEVLLRIPTVFWDRELASLLGAKTESPAGSAPACTAVGTECVKGEEMLAVGCPAALGPDARLWFDPGTFLLRGGRLGRLTILVNGGVPALEGFIAEEGGSGRVFQVMATRRTQDPAAVRGFGSVESYVKELAAAGAVVERE